MKHTLSQEAYLDEEFKLLGVRPHIRHIKQDPSCVYSFVTVATLQYDTYRNFDITIARILHEGSIRHKTGSALSALLATRLAEYECGVAACHAIDNFSRKIGRITAKGRLLKILRAGWAKNCYVHRNPHEVVVNLRGSPDEVLIVRAFGKDLGIEIKVDDAHTGVVIYTKHGVVRVGIAHVSPVRESPLSEATHDG